MVETKTTQSLNEIFGIAPSQENLPEVVEGDENRDENRVDNFPLTAVDAPNLPAIPDGRTDEERAEDEDFKEKASEDYELARGNYHELLAKGENLLDLAIEIAESTQDPKSIDSAAKLLTNLMGANSKLLEITKAKQEVFMRTRAKEVLKTAFADAGNTTTNINPQTINNNNTLFVGSPSDLNKMLKELKAEKNKEHDEP